MTMEQIKHDLQTTFEQVKSAVGWSVDKKISLSIASYYVTTGKSVNGKLLLETSDAIKKKAGWFSPLRSHIHYMMAAFLQSNHKDASVAVEELLSKQESLKSVGFKSNSYSYLSAILLSSHPNQQVEEAKRAKSLYDAMKSHHPFLTQADDYPYAVMLGKLEGDPQERATTMNRYYAELRPQGFYMGNELQWMSQILTYTSPKYDASMVSKAVHIRDQLKNSGVKVKMTHYVMIGFLAVLSNKDSDIQHVIDTYRELQGMKLFGWYKDMILPLAVQLETKHLIEQNETSAVSLATTIEMLMQAQQAAMISTMVATNAAIAASSGSDGSS
ncbi:DUF4003 family protein [Paenisporosarcina indica]|uniref:DUF4003 family protein n=1 Tax=Paenisporosarcina indica TaxID=650093 RepID=UPI00094FFEED|nr:DUF4003 family protein [Paenisporosarcina indica]